MSMRTRSSESAGQAAPARADRSGRSGRRRRAFVRAFTQPARYAALLAGALPVLAFPSLNLEFLAWFGLVPGLLLLRAAPTGREAAVRGWWLGIGYLLMALYWLTPNLGPAVLLVAIVLGLPWAGFGFAAGRLLGPPGPSWREALAALGILRRGHRGDQGGGGPAGVQGDRAQR